MIAYRIPIAAGNAAQYSPGADDRAIYEALWQAEVLGIGSRAVSVYSRLFILTFATNFRPPHLVHHQKTLLIGTKNININEHVYIYTQIPTHSLPIGVYLPIKGIMSNHLVDKSNMAMQR